jgi:hypothetical protein
MPMTTKGKSLDPTVQVAYINRRSAIITAVCGVLIALIGAFGAYVAGRKQGADIAAQSAVTVTRTVAATGAVQGSTSGGEPDSRESGVPVDANVVPAQVQIDAGTGVDLDVGTPELVPASGPNGDLDLHFDGTSLTAARAGLFNYYGTEGEAPVGCPKIVASEQPVVGGVYDGVFCLRTTEGTIGWINFNDIKMKPETGYVVINYKLFG